MKVVIYKGPNLIIADGLITYTEKSIELNTHIPFPKEADGKKYIIPTSVEKLALPDGNYQVIMKGIIREKDNEK